MYVYKKKYYKRGILVYLKPQYIIKQYNIKTMKIYKIRPLSNPIYASIHAQMRQPFEQGERIRVTWNDYLSKGNLVPDFLYSSYVICKREIAMELKQKFKSLEIGELEWHKNPKEIVAKDIRRLKWLPKEEVDLVHIYSKINIPILPQSTVIISKGNDGKDWIKDYIGEETLFGTKHTPRELGKGIFIDKRELGGYDFFRIEKSTFLLCTENVKEYIEKRGFSNVLFLEVGDIIEN